VNRKVKTLVKEKVPLNSYKVTWQLYLDSNLTATYVGDSIEAISQFEGEIVEHLDNPLGSVYLLGCEGKEFVYPERIVKARISSKVVTKTRYVDIYKIEIYEDDISIFGQLKGSRFIEYYYEGVPSEPTDFASKA
jgi:hypothetical protein